MLIYCHGGWYFRLVWNNASTEPGHTFNILAIQFHQPSTTSHLVWFIWPVWSSLLLILRNVTRVWPHVEGRVREGVRCCEFDSHIATVSCTISGGQRPLCSSRRGSHHHQDKMSVATNMSTLYRHSATRLFCWTITFVRLRQTSWHVQANQSHTTTARNWWIFY